MYYVESTDCIKTCITLNQLYKKCITLNHGKENMHYAELTLEKHVLHLTHTGKTSITLNLQFKKRALS